MRALKEDVLKDAMNHLIRSWCCYYLFFFVVAFPIGYNFYNNTKKGKFIEKKGKTRISMQIYNVQTK